MKILFLILDNPVSPNYKGGGAARFSMYFESLVKLDSNIVVWRAIDNRNKKSIEKFETQVDLDYQDHIRSKALDWKDHYYNLLVSQESIIKWLPKALISSIGFKLRPYSELLIPIQKEILEVKPDIIWANHFIMGAIIAHLNLTTPWVADHHDWLYKLQLLKLKNRSLKDKVKGYFKSFLTKKAEISVIRKAPIIVAGSQTETLEIRSFGGKNVFTIPTGFNIDNSFSQNEKFDDKLIRIFHFGSLMATANRIGLERYLEIVHEKLSKKAEIIGKEVELILVGSLETTNNKIRNLIDSFNNIKQVGYIKDVTRLFYKGAIQILPYEYDTGTRTRVPFLFAHSQVLIAVSNSVSCLPEVVHNENALLINKLDCMADTILSVYSDLEKRDVIAEAARLTYEKHYSIEAQLPIFRNVINVPVN